ncbi:MAG: Uma2 family endonuclease [Oscillospiraceae bacterium]|nr:Uma2 family endonuclease [Oscillospiraceae bacterium]
MNTNLAYAYDCREELINGKVVAMSPAASNHNRIAGDIYGIFWSYLRGKKCEPFGDGEAVYLTEVDHFIPDFMVVCDPDKVKSNGVHGAPDLVVEVLSPGTTKNDRGRKMDVYGQCGVREYWIVIPNEKTVEQYIQDNGRLVLHDVYFIPPDYTPEKELAEIAKEFQCSLFDDLTIRLEDIFERVK